MSRTEPITRLEVAACPTHRQEVRHYAGHEVGCDCLGEDRRQGLATRLAKAREDGSPMADMAE